MEIIMIKELDLIRQQASLESFSVSGTAAVLKSIIPSLHGTFSSFVNHFNPTTPFVALSGEQTAFLKQVPKHTYMDVAPLTAFVPEGLNTDYREYADYLMAAANHASLVLNEVLSPYSTFLSRLITNKEQQLDTTSMDKQFAALAAKREALAADMAGCFKKGSTKTEVTMKDVIERQRDWEEVFHKINAMSKLVMDVDRKALNKKIEECSNYLNTLMQLATRDKLDRVTPEVVRGLADGAYQAASELEFFAVTYYRVMALNASVNRTMQHFNNVMKTT
jgi:hypothetical protein